MNGIISITSATIPLEETVNSLISVLSNVYYAGQEDIKRLGETFRVADATVTESVQASMATEPELIPYECCRSSGALSFWDDESEDIYSFEKGKIAQETGPSIEEFAAPVSQACKEFCDLRGLNSVLAKCLVKVKEIFSNIVGLSAELDYFWDEGIEDSTHVVIRIKVSSDQKTALSEYDSWVNWIIQNISPNESNFFTLTVQRI